MTASTQMTSTRDLSVTHRSPLSAMLILVGGLPGAGKTYFASRLSKRLGATYISSELMRKKIDAQGQYAFEDKLNVYEHMASRAANHLRQKNPVVVDATFYSKQMREMFFTIAKLMHIRCALIEVAADEDVIKKRLGGSTDSGKVDLSVYHLVKSKYEQPDVPYLVIESTDFDVEQMVRKAMQYIATIDQRR